MTELSLVVILYACGLLIFDGVFVGSLYKSWIKKGRLVSMFPEWKNTKKPIVWFLVWSIIFFLNVPLFVGLSFRLGTIKKLLIPIMVSCPLYTFVWVIVCFIVCLGKSQ